jgi:hypothetical protein
MHWLKAVYFMVPKHGDSENSKRRVEATEMDALKKIL